MPDQFERLKSALADRYLIERPLGRGGMATVYLATDLRHDRPVAVKVLHPELSATLGAERFLREIRIAARLNHPHILPLHDSGEVDDFLFYVMPVEGESLRQRLSRDGTVPLKEALKIAGEVLDALDYAHSEGVVHRDIKPENILFSRGHAVVADFGIARAITVAGGEQLTQAGVPIGTPAYMSIEQLRGDPRLDGRTDIYAMGCVLYEMLVGKPLFTQVSPGGTLADASADTSSDDHSPLEDLPGGIRQTVATAIQGEPEDRFTNAAEFAKALSSGASSAAEPLQQQTKSAEQSIAVLPFTNMSGDEENEYFSDGMTEEIINALTQLKNLRVAARTSSFVFKGQTVDIAEVGARLHVATVLEGSVRRAGKRLRITVQLANVADGYEIWSEKYDREMNDVFAIQDEIATAIAERLKLALSVDASEPLVTPPTGDLEAYQLYLRGRHLWNKRSKAGLERALEYFQQAIERDSSFALAHSGLADTYLLLGLYHLLPEDEANSKAKAAAERALELDETLAEAHASREQALRWERDWRGEEREYRRAIELNPAYATAHQWYATLLARLGRMDESLREIRTATRLDPLSHAICITAANVLYLTRDYDAAMEQVNKALELEPNFPSGYAWLGYVCVEKGMYSEALQANERLMDLWGYRKADILLARAFIYARQGEREKALDILARVQEQSRDPSFVAGLYAALGEADRAFEWLEKGVEKGSRFLFYLKVHPVYDPVRSDPRFKQLLAKMGLE